MGGIVRGDQNIRFRQILQVHKTVGAVQAILKRGARLVDVPLCVNRM